MGGTQGGIQNGSGVGWWRVGVEETDRWPPRDDGVRGESPKRLNSAGGGVGVQEREAEKNDLDRGSPSESEASVQKRVFVEMRLDWAIV
jgi:hypothetical protein